MANERLRAALIDSGRPLDEVAQRVGIHPKTLNRWVEGRRPHRRYQYALGNLLGADPAVLWPEPGAAVPNALPGGALPAPGEEMAQIGARLERLARNNVDAATLRHLGLSLEEVSAAYERDGGAAVYRLVRQQRHWIEHLMEEQQRPRDRVELHAAAGKLSAVLGYLAFDLGHRTLAEAYLGEAFSLGEAAADRDLMAWVRGLQSFVAFYAGRYHAALEYARHGQVNAGGGPQSVRLAVAGEARALGRLGDAYAVAEAVERALGARERHPGGQPVGEFLSMEPLGVGRIHGNAASAYLALGDSARVQEHAERALEVFSGNASAASEALTAVDLAVSHLSGRGADPEAAAAAIRRALDVGAGLQSDVVAARLHDFVVISRRWAGPELIETVEAVEEWRRRAVPPPR